MAHFNFAAEWKRFMKIPLLREMFPYHLQLFEYSDYIAAIGHGMRSKRLVIHLWREGWLVVNDKNNHFVGLIDSLIY